MFPEQYDVFDGTTDKRVAYIRMRHGEYSVTVPYWNGKNIIRGFAGDYDDAGFFTDEERPILLAAFEAAILKYYEGVTQDV